MREMSRLACSATFHLSSGTAPTATFDLNNACQNDVVVVHPPGKWHAIDTTAIAWDRSSSISSPAANNSSSLDNATTSDAGPTALRAKMCCAMSSAIG